MSSPSFLKPHARGGDGLASRWPRETRESTSCCRSCRSLSPRCLDSAAVAVRLARAARVTLPSPGLLPSQAAGPTPLMLVPSCGEPTQVTTMAGAWSTAEGALALL